MDFRKASERDIESILQMYEDGSKSLKNDGVDQWQGNDKPGYDELIKIIDEIFVLDDNGAVATARIMTYDAQYDEIIDGNWLNNSKNYYSVHRVATLESKKRNGYAKLMMEYIEEKAKKEKIKSIKIDTHKENIKMQKFLEKLGYLYCGKIILNIGSERNAYEKIL